MADDPIVTMLKAVQTKLKTASFITDPDNVIIGESDPHTLSKLGNTKYPRMETLITMLKGQDYDCQQNQNEDYRISIAGYIRRASVDTTEDDMYDIMNAGLEVKSLMYSFNDDNIADPTDPVEGFDYVGGFYELGFEYELFDKLASFIIEVEFKFNFSTVGRT